MDNTPFAQSANLPESDDKLPEDLQVIARYYATQPVPHPSHAETSALMQQLLVAAPLAVQEKQRWEHTSLWHIFVVARWRVFLLGPWFWITGVLLFFITGAIAWNAQGPSYVTQTGTIMPTGINLLILFLVLVLPLSAVMSLAYALRTSSAGLRAIEASCPVNFVQTTMSMVLVVLAFDCLFGFLLTLGVALVHWAPFWTLLLAWLAPLLLLTAISLPLAFLYNVRVAMVIGGLPWLLLGFSAIAVQNTPSVATWLFSLPQDTLALSSHLIITVLSLVVLIMLFYSAPRWQRFCTF